MYKIHLFIKFATVKFKKNLIKYFIKMVNILFPGRHHILTKYQFDYLNTLAKNKKIDQVIFAVTSSNHENTRRNPIPFYLRVLAIDKFSKDLNCKVKIYPIPDIKYTNEFAEYIIRQIYYQGGEKITAKNTMLACSTPSVIALFKKLKFRNYPVELIEGKKERYCALRPFEIVNLLVRAGNNWRKINEWKKYAHSSSIDVYLQYNVGDLIIELFNDSILNPDAEFTDTRDYNTYAQAMDNIIHIKFNDIKPFVVEGKIVDVGCSTGSLIRLLAEEFKESDIIGIEGTRKFYEFCKLQEYKNPFVFFYRKNILDKNFSDNSINTFICSSVLHEVYSYIGKDALSNFLKNTYKQLSHKGRLIIRDVVGPENGNAIIYMKLNNKDGKNNGNIKVLSTYSKFMKFTDDFIPRKIKYEKVNIGNKKLMKLKLADAYEYLSKMTYVDNWKSEMHEEFGFYSFSQWAKALIKIGYNIVPGSKPFSSSYITENVYKPRVKLYELKNKKLEQIEYPPTNMILVGEKN